MNGSMKLSRVYLLFLAAIVIAWSNPRLAGDDAAMELTREQESAASYTDAEVHVIGIYMPENGTQDDRVYVHIKNTGKPLVIVLCGYSDAQWNLDVDQGTTIREVIVSGWFNQDIVGVPDGVPTKLIIGSTSRNKQADKNYFWSYAWHTENGRDMVRKIAALTGLQVSSYQGVYQGKQFTIDGKLGTPPDQLPGGTVQPSPAGTISESNGVKPSALQDRKSVEAFVRRSFQLDLEQTQARIKQAEAKLAEVKANFAKRKLSAEELIQQRIVALMPNDLSVDSAGSASQADVSDPTGKGWQLWNEQKSEEALEMFKISVRRYPDSGPAWNGLGWALYSLRKHDEAKVAFEKCLVIEPTNGGARNGLGRVLMAMNELDAAEKEFLQATTEIIAELGEAKAVASGVTAAWFGLVEVNLLQNDFNTAKSWAERYLKHKADEPQMKEMLEACRSS